MLLAKGWIIKIHLVEKPLSDLKIETLKRRESETLFNSLYKKMQGRWHSCLLNAEAATFNCILKGGGCLNRSLYPQKRNLELS